MADGEKSSTERNYERAERARHAMLPPTPGLWPRAHDLGVPGALATAPAVHRAIDATTDDPHPSNPTDEVHQEVERVIGNIAAGKVTPPARKALRGALDKAEAPPSGRAKSDAAIGRIAGLR